MRRLYYVADNVDDAEAVTAALQTEGVSHWHLHVLAKDAAGLYTHKIHSANPIHQLDFVRTGARYALAGLLSGCLLAVVLYGLSSWEVINLPTSPMVFVVLGLVGLCFGAWEGGLVGLTRENYKIERFHQEIEAGKYLIMVDVNKDQRPVVKELMNFEFPRIPYRGGDTTRIHIFGKPKVTYHQTTH